METVKKQESNSSAKYVCPLCGGSHWILSNEEVEGYGELLFAKPCPNCKKKFREEDESGMPLQYVEADLPGFNFDSYGKDMSDFRKTVFSFFDDFQKWESLGMGLYFCSVTPGSGKTLLACSVARSVSLKYDLKTRFITANDYLSLVGESYHRDSGTADQSAVYRDCDLLVLDDLGAQKKGDWQDAEMFRLVNDRITSGKLMIITSNSPQDELNLADRTIDRIISCTLPLALPEISIRRKKAEQKQQKMVSEILKGKGK